MIQTNTYLVGGHAFAIDAEERIFPLLTNYAPFLTDQIGASHVFIIHVSEDPMPAIEGWEAVYTDRSDEDMPRIEMYRREGEWLFRLSVARESDIVCAMRCAADWSEVHLYFQAGYERFAIDNAAMLAYAFRTTEMHTLLFHSSVTVRNGIGYMFLGHSGTGKSTHSQQWHKAFPESHLLNDDNPVVRILDNGEVHVYGSPWSGKTPCYINDEVPVGALVQLAQAPINKITRLRMTQAYPYILSSVSGLKILPESMDAIYDSIAKLLELTPVFRLECLPNEQAARICAQMCSL